MRRHLTGLLVILLGLGWTAAASAEVGPPAGTERIRAYELAHGLAGSAFTPAFARQTGLACNVCHLHYPELTATGRAFKLNGYVYRRADSVQGRNPTGGENLMLNLVAPLSFMVQTSYTRTSAAQPGTKNGTVFFPDQLSIFTGGEITSHVGGFLQVTFDPQSGQLGVDNADFRYAGHGTIAGRHTLYGLSLNNNPTVQDPWNSTPAWGFPYGSSSAAPAPAASTLIDGQLGQQVAGLTAYTMWNDRLYLEVGGYYPAPVGVARPIDTTAAGTIDGLSPYWRVALPFTVGSHSLSVGAYGMNVKVRPAGITGPTNRFNDVALDMTWLASMGANTFTLDGTWIHESQRWDAGGTANARNTLNTMRFDAMFHVGHMYAFTLAPFSTSGTADAQLYAPAQMTGSRTGSPNSRGVIGEIDFMPWQNLRFQLQYVDYQKFNGASADYDGSGRSAANNNTLYFLTWLLF